MITPNQFETEQLTGVSIETIPDAQRACGILHDIGVPLILITSITFQKSEKQMHNESPTIGMFTSQRTYNSANKSDGAGFLDEQYILYAPLIPGRFTGTGDICAALFLAWTANASDDSYSLKFALEKLGGKNTYLVLCLRIKSSCFIQSSIFF